MKVSETKDIIDEEGPAHLGDDEGTMAELRSLLLGPAEAQLAEVHTRLFDPQRQVEEISKALPDAIAVRTRQDDELTTALSPAVSAALEHSVRKDPKPLADAIFPIMGPAIRKAIAAALSGMVQSFNQTLTHSLSAKGLRWRFEALTTGRSFSEVVLLHTLVYRVEQVFLIHRETGLLLQHVSAGSAVVNDADMVSGMLTAIQDFVQDSFKTGKGDELETLQVGDLTVWIEQGPLAILAGVIRGNAPQELRQVFQETLERIHLQFGSALKGFSGDAAEFVRVRPLLEECFQAGYDKDQELHDQSRKITPFRVLAAVILIAFLVWGFFWIRDRRRWNAYLDRLRSEPGIVVTDAGKEGSKYFVNGLRDPLAREPTALISGTGLAQDAVVGHWQSFQALTPDFVLARARQSLDAPSTVKLNLKDNVLEVEGFARHQWIVDARKTARLLPGVNKLGEKRLFELERIENPLLMFELDQTKLRPGQDDKLNQLVQDILTLQQLIGPQQVRLEITGRTDNTGTEARNTALSQGRADAVAEFLRSRLPSDPNLKVVTTGTKDKLRQEITEDDRATNRSVTLKVVINNGN
jgi:outer membrane protein OmpA-like peptidoglycan-associated protein